jgi:hypothetical protein
MTELVIIMERYKLDFDDAYQYLAAEKFRLTLVSFDRDFDGTEKEGFQAELGVEIGCPSTTWAPEKKLGDSEVSRFRAGETFQSRQCQRLTGGRVAKLVWGCALFESKMHTSEELSPCRMILLFSRSRMGWG